MTKLEPPKAIKTKLGFSGHETFPFRYTWLKKAVDGVKKDSSVFSEESAIVDLGVGKNMVTSIKHWAFLAGLLHDTGKKIEISPLGKNLLDDDGWDPYLEDVGSLWILHWKICTNIKKATTWFFAFNKLTQIEFTKDHLVHEIVSFGEALNVKASPSIIARDVDCFIRTYVPSRNAKLGLLEDSLDCPLTELSLIQEVGQRGLYVFTRGPKRELPDEIFTYALLEYWNGMEQQTNALPFDEIAYGAGSPGLVFKLDEDSLSYRLDSLEKMTRGVLTYDETSGLRQVYRKKVLASDEFLRRYFEKSVAKRKHAA